NASSDSIPASFAPIRAPTNSPAAMIEAYGTFTWPRRWYSSAPSRPTGSSSAASDVPLAVCWGSLATSTSPGMITIAPPTPNRPDTTPATRPITPTSSHVTAAPSQAIRPKPQRILHLEYLDGRIAGVRHPDMHAGWAVGAVARSLPSTDHFVVGPPTRPPSPVPRPSEGHVVHRALPLRRDGDAAAREREEHGVRDALGGLDVPRRHRAREAGVHDAALGRRDPHD